MRRFLTFPVGAFAVAAIGAAANVTVVSAHLEGVGTTAPVTEVSRVSPARGSDAGGTALEIDGRGFAPVDSIAIGGVTIPCQALPAGAAGAPTARDAFARIAEANNAAWTRVARSLGPRGSRSRPPTYDGKGECLRVSGRRLFALTPAHRAGAVQVDVLGSYVSFTYTTPPPPVVYAVDPHIGGSPGGTFVNIWGAGFTGEASVTFGGVASPGFSVIAWFDYLITANSPGGTAGTSVDVQVTTPNGTSATSAADLFTYTPPPVPSVSAIDPTSSSSTGGDSISIYGAGFLGATTVQFGSTSVPATVVNDNLVQANDPPGTVGPPLDVTVTTPGGTSPITTADRFTYVTPPVPVITGLGPLIGPTAGGTEVYIMGTGLLGVSAVDFGSTAATSYDDSSSTVIEAFSPAGTGSVKVKVTTPGGTATSSSSFTYTNAPPPTTPEIDAMSLHSGNAAGGTLLQIAGHGFSGFTQLLFGSTPADVIPFCVFDCDHIFAMFPGSPAGTPGTTVDVRFVTANGTSPITTADKFTYVAMQPVITGIAPVQGYTEGGTSVNIYGSGLAGVQSATFGSNPAATVFPPLVDSQLQISSPPGSLGTVDISVTAPGGTSVTTPGDRFTYVATPTPTVSGVGPDTGTSAGGTTVYVSGTGLTAATAVMFGSTPATSFTLGDDGLLTAVSPPGIGQVDVRVTTPMGTSPIAPGDLYGYLGPPPPPVTIVATPGLGQAVITWVAPSWDGGSAITAYTVHCLPSCTLVVVSGSTFMATVTGLDGAYRFTVSATNGSGEGPPSAPTAVIQIRGSTSPGVVATPSPRQPVEQSSPVAAPSPRG